MIIHDRRTSEKLLEIPGDTLVGRDLSKFELRYADLSNLDLNLCNFGGRDLEGVQFSNSNLTEVVMTGCNLAEAIFTRAIAPRAMFNKTILSMTAFSYALLEEADFSEIVVAGMVNFRWIVAPRSKFRNIKNLSGANFFEADLTDSNFDGSDFAQVGESDRTGTILKGTIFEHLTC